MDYGGCVLLCVLCVFLSTTIHQQGKIMYKSLVPYRNQQKSLILIFHSIVKLNVCFVCLQIGTKLSTAFS